MHDEKVTVWYGITSMFILCPWFFEDVADGNMQTCTVMSARYRGMLSHYAIPELQWQNALHRKITETTKI